MCQSGEPAPGLDGPQDGIRSPGQDLAAVVLVTAFLFVLARQLCSSRNTATVSLGKIGTYQVKT
jgi:hypothetical protein